VDQLRISFILLFPWSQVDEEAADTRGAEGIAMGAVDARVAEGNAIGGELARGIGNGSMEIREETNLHEDGRKHASKPSASVEVSALLHNRSMFLNWV
jgi:hypothetical protein